MFDVRCSLWVRCRRLYSTLRLTPLASFIPTPTQTKCIQSTLHTSPRHENIIHSSLPSSPPISEPSSLTPLNGSNSTKNAYFSDQLTPGFFLYQPLPKPNVSSQLPTPPPTRKYHSFLSPSISPNLSPRPGGQSQCIVWTFVASL
jgi:hypothetical protein